MRTNIEIDDELMRQAMAATGATTKKATVEACLRKLIEVQVLARAMDSAMKLREESRLAAIRDSRLDEWFEELRRTGTRFEEGDYADEH